MRLTNKTRHPGWCSLALHQPRRLWPRRAVFQIHLWCGLIVGLFATVAGLTGSAIVYREALDRRLAPSLYTVSAGPTLSADDLLSDARRQLPSYRIESFDIEGGSTPWLYRLEDTSGRRSTAFLDPATGRLLGVRGEREGVMNWLDDLHTELLGGQIGTWVNGAGALGLLVLCLTGIVVWWPGRGRVRRALRIHLPRRWRRFNWDLHSAGGFWISLPLAIEAFSGAILCFGFAWVLVLFGGRAAEFTELLSSPPLQKICTPSGQQLQPLLQRALDLNPVPVDTLVVLPANDTTSVTVYTRTAADLRAGSVSVMAFDPCDQKLLKNVNSRDASASLRIVLFLDAFHFGLIGGNMTRIAWLFLGLAPGLLFGTGLVLWWYRVAKPAFIRRNRPKLEVFGR